MPDLGVKEGRFRPSGGSFGYCAHDPNYRDPCPRHNAGMGVSDVSYMVRGRTEEQCREALDELCRLLGAVVTSLPSDALGRGWVARAVMPKAPAGGEGLDGR